MATQTQEDETFKVEEEMKLSFYLLFEFLLPILISKSLRNLQCGLSK